MLTKIINSWETTQERKSCHNIPEQSGQASVLLVANTPRTKSIGKYGRISPRCTLPASANSSLDASEAGSLTTVFSNYQCNLLSLHLPHLCLSISIRLPQDHVAMSYTTWKSSSWLSDNFTLSALGSSSRADTEWLLPIHLFLTLHYLYLSVLFSHGHPFSKLMCCVLFNFSCVKAVLLLWSPLLSSSPI